MRLEIPEHNIPRVRDALQRRAELLRQPTARMNRYFEADLREADRIIAAAVAHAMREAER